MKSHYRDMPIFAGPMFLLLFVLVHKRKQTFSQQRLTNIISRLIIPFCGLFVSKLNSNISYRPWSEL